ncbi:MAG: hypothetical protein FWF15_00705 [Oscillospiraceae bacterium]|nr:hypothetical protein [Oscillospiraceae bacterium]
MKKVLILILALSILTSCSMVENLLKNIIEKREEVSESESETEPVDISTEPMETITIPEETTNAKIEADIPVIMNLISLSDVRISAEEAGFETKYEPYVISIFDSYEPKPIEGIWIITIKDNIFYGLIEKDRILVLEYLTVEEARLYAELMNEGFKNATYLRNCIFNYDKFYVEFYFNEEPDDMNYYRNELIDTLFSGVPAEPDNSVGLLTQEEFDGLITNFNISLVYKAEGQETYYFHQLSCDEFVYYELDDCLLIDIKYKKIYELYPDKKTGVMMDLPEDYNYQGFYWTVANYLFIHTNYMETNGFKRSGNDMVAGRDVTIYTITLNDAEQTFWIDNEYGFTLKFVQTGVNNITMEVTEFIVGGVTLENIVDLSEYEIVWEERKP